MRRNDAESVESLANRVFSDDTTREDEDRAGVDKLEYAIRRLPKSEQTHLFEFLRDEIEKEQERETRDNSPFHSIPGRF